MTRDEKIAEARRLSAEGYNNAEIGRALGVVRHTVWKWLNPERHREIARGVNARRAPQKRAWENSMRASCAQCGRPMVAGSLHADGTQNASKVKGVTCAACRSEHRVELVLAMWRLRCDENLLNKQIAERLGIPAATVATELSRLRALGHAVPAAPYNGAETRPPRAASLDASAVRLGRMLRERGITPERGLEAAA